MKVVVRCAHNRVTKADMEREIERLFQENKGLRLSESHLKDELNLISQQSEVRRQKMVEKDKEIERMHTKIANVGAERDDFEASYKQVLHWWEEAQSRAIKTEERADEYRIALMESECRVDECEKRMDWLSKEVMEWKATAEGYKNQYEELKAQKEADDKKSEEICAACNEQYETVLSDRNHLREEVARLTNERDAAVNENTVMTFDFNELRDKWEVERNLHIEADKQIEELKAEVDTCRHNIDGYIEGNRRMRAEYEKKLETEQGQTKHWRKRYDELQEKHNELEADYDALAQTKREYAEEIDRLRRVVTELQTNRFTTDEFIGMIMKNFVPSADK